MAAPSPALQPSVVIEALSKAFSVVFSQALGAAWTVTAADASSNQFADAPSLVFELKHSGGLSGTATIEICTSDVLLLAQKFLSEEPNPEIELTQDHKEAILELLRQVAGVAETGLKPQFGEVKIEVSLSEKTATQDGSVLLAATTDAGQKIWLAFHVGNELRASIAQPSVQPALPPRPVNHAPESNLDLLLGVNLGLTLRFGQRVLTLRDILDLTSGSVVELDRQVHEPADLLLGDRLIAKGEVVIIDGNYGLRITEIEDPHTRARSLSGVDLRS